MRIFIAHNFYKQPGGEDAVYRSESAMLERAGHDVIRHDIGNDQISGGLAAARAAWDAPHSAKQYNSLRARFEQQRPDVVHVHNFFPLITPSIFDAARDAGAATVLTLHNYRLTCANGQLYRKRAPCTLCVEGSPWQGALHRCYRGSLPASIAAARMISHHRKTGTWQDKVDRFIALSEDGRATFINAGLPPARIAVKPNFLPAESLPPAMVGHRKGFLFVGRLSAEKGVAELVDLWREIDEPLTIIGDGPERARLQASAPSNVTFTGSQPIEDVRTAMASARGLLVPSRWAETFGLVVIEAYAAALPVVASRIGALGELVAQNETGYLADPDDNAGWCRSVKQLASDDAMVRRMGAAGRAMFERNYTESRNLGQLEEIYRQAIASAGDAAQSPAILA